MYSSIKVQKLRGGMYAIFVDGYPYSVRSGFDGVLDALYTYGTDRGMIREKPEVNIEEDIEVIDKCLDLLEKKFDNIFNENKNLKEEIEKLKVEKDKYKDLYEKAKVAGASDERIKAIIKDILSENNKETEE